jgi:hypothetical protein
MFAVGEKYHPEKWRAVLTGAFVCGIFGPAIGALLTLAREAVRQKSFRGAGDVFLAFPYLLPAAVFVMGPAGLIVGSAGSLVLQALSARVRSIKALGVCAAGLGLALGTAVPLIAAVLSLWSQSSISEVLPLSMAVGITCGVVTVWLLHRWHLLRQPA